MMWWYGPGMSGWGYALMAVGTILFWALLILAGIALARYLRTGTERTPQMRQHPTPDQLLAERFARGEIDEQEYRQRLDTLHHTFGSLRQP